MTKETEQLDELSKEKLSAYIGPAKSSALELTKDYLQKTKKVGPRNYSPEGLKSLHKAQRREKGIDRAEARMRGERKVPDRELNSRIDAEKNHPIKNFFRGEKIVHNRYYKPYHAEETEQLDELSRKTLNSYKTAANKDKNASEKEAVGKYPYEPGSEGDKESDKLYDRADKRRAGMSAARRRLKGYYSPKKAKYHAEETEINELKKPLAPYIKKAATQLQWWQGESDTTPRKDFYNPTHPLNKANRKRKGIENAADRLMGKAKVKWRDTDYDAYKSYHAEETQLDECGCKMKMAIKKKMEEKRDI